MVPMRVRFRQVKQRFLHLTLDPPSLILPQDKEVRGVPNPDVLLAALIPQFDSARLIVKLDDLGIMLHEKHGSQFITMTLALDRAGHFLTGIAATDVSGRAADTVGWS